MQRVMQSECQAGRSTRPARSMPALRRTSGLHDESCAKFGLTAHAIASAAAVCAYNIRQAGKHRKQQEQAAAEADDEQAATPTQSTSTEYEVVLLAPTETPGNGQQGDFEPAADSSVYLHGDPISHPQPTGTCAKQRFRRP